MKPLDNSTAEKTCSASLKHVLSTNSDSPPADEVKRIRLIAEAAYYRAEARGFIAGHEVEDWLAAEAEVNHLFQPAWLINWQY